MRAFLLIALSWCAACSQAPDDAAPAAATARRDVGTGELLFARGEPLHGELAVLDLGSGQQRVLGAPAGACEASWSPDGGRLLFRAPHEGRWALATLAADGSDLRWLAPGFSSFMPSWEPDGRRILTGAEPEPSTELPAGSAAHPAHPDAKPEPAAMRAGSMAVYSMPADGSAAPDLLAEGHSPLLSPDGIWVIVERSSAREDLLVLHRPSGSLAPLTSALEYTGMAFAPAGDHLYLGRRLAVGARQIIGTTWPVIHWKQVTTGETDRLPRPSPDGRTLAFVRTLAPASADAGNAGADGHTSARDEVCTRDLSTGAERLWPLAGERRDDETLLHELQWSPDATRLALTLGAEGKIAPRRLLLLDMRDGSVSELLDATPAQLAGLAWRPAAAMASGGPAGSAAK